MNRATQSTISEIFGHLHMVLWCVLLVFAPGCRTAATWHVEDPKPAIARLRSDGSIKAEADSLVQPLLARGEVSGMVVGVVGPDGATQTFQYGRAGGRNDPQPPGPDSVFQVGSISKLFVEILVARMFEEGQIRYSDTVRSLLPPEIQVSEDIGRLTVYELATHTGGLPREPFTLTQFGSFVRYLVTGQNLYAPLTRPYMDDYLQNAHLDRSRQGKFFYSNIGIGLLSELLEARTGRPVTELVEEKICHPLQMHDSVFVLNDDQRRRLTLGHVGNQACWKSGNTPMPPWDMGDWMRSSAGMYSTLNDLLLFARANLGMSPGPLDRALATTHQLRVATERGGEGFGWIIQPFASEREVLTFKSGMVSGYCGYIGLNLQRKVAVVVLSNTFSWDERVGHNLLLRLSGACAPAQTLVLQR